MKQPEISVIVPAFNTETYIIPCVESLLRQTFCDFEIVIVDDGSTDHTGQICEEMKKKDGRIQVIHQENGGLMGAWMRGFQHSRGRYISFVDSDDTVEEGYLLQMFTSATSNGADLVVGPARAIERGKDGGRIPMKLSDGVYDRDSICREIFPNMLNDGGFQSRGFPVSRWAKLFRRERIEENLVYCDKNICYGEDLNLVFAVVQDCHCINVIGEEDAMYYYMANPDSIVHTYKKDLYGQAQKLFAALTRCYTEKNCYDFSGQIYADYLAEIVYCYTNELIRPRCSMREIRHEIEKLARDQTFAVACERTDWSHYSLLHRIIISSLRRFRWFDKTFVISMLHLLRRLKRNG
jgi:glycosyltransferase involved in cell wall biosynthesis